MTNQAQQGSNEAPKTAPASETKPAPHQDQNGGGTSPKPDQQK